jgi:hypothetical protein
LLARSWGFRFRGPYQMPSGNSSGAAVSVTIGGESR